MRPGMNSNRDSRRSIPSWRGSSHSVEISRVPGSETVEYCIVHRPRESVCHTCCYTDRTPRNITLVFKAPQNI
jgi:hypothetical protein